MRDFLSIQLEEVSGEPPLAMFTVTSNIEGVQSALSSGWETASGRSTIPLLLRLLEMQSSQDPRHPALSITDDGRVSYREPVCPGCGSREHKLNGTQARTLQCFFGMALDMRLQKYVCKACGKAYKVELGHIVPRHGHYTRDVRGLAIGYTGGRALSLEESVELTHQVSGVRPSRETVRLWKLSAGRRIRKEMSERQAEWSGVYSYDEQYVRIGGERKYRCLVYDSGRKEPVGEMIVADLDKRTLKRFLGRVLRGKPVLTMVTDGMEQYPELLREMFPEASHQVCVIHTMYNAKMDLKEAAGLGKESSKPLPEGLAALYGALWDVFLHSDSVEEAEEKYQAIYARRFDYHPKVVHRLELMAEKLPRLTEYLAHPDVPMTNNPAEAYFHRTHPERIKRRFRTKDGLEAQVMCLEAGQVDGISGEGDTQETLRRIYETFAKLMVNV